MSRMAYMRCSADGRIYVFEEPVGFTEGWTRATEQQYRVQQADAREEAHKIWDTKKPLRDAVKAQIFGVNVQLDDADLAEVPLGVIPPGDFRPFSRKLNIVFKGGGQFLFSDYIWNGKVFTSEAEMIDYAVDEMLKQLGLVE